MSWYFVFDFIQIAPNILCILFGWFFFFKVNNNIFLIKPQVFDVIKIHVTVVKKFQYVIFLKWSLVCFVCLIYSLCTIRGRVATIFFNHLIINDFSLRFLIFFSIIGVVCFYILYLSSAAKLVIVFDFFFSIFNLLIFLPLIFLSNTFFTFFFFLEIGSFLIFYKFLSSRFFYKNNFNSSIFKTFEKFNKLLPKNFLNVLFFQYWVTFFSSILILIFLIQLIQIFGSSEWTFINFLNCILTNSSFNDISIFYFMFLIFIISFFFKIGIVCASFFVSLFIYKL